MNTLKYPKLHLASDRLYFSTMKTKRRTQFPRTDLVLVKAAAPAIKEAKTAVFILGDRNAKSKCY